MQPISAVQPRFQIYYLSERAVTIEFGYEINEDTLARISGFNHYLNNNPFRGFYSSIPAYTTLSVFFDPLQVISAPNIPGEDCFEKVSGYLLGMANISTETVINQADKITIPVCYGGNFGPDLAEVAAMHRLTVEQVISLHSTAIYKVYMIGFVPGFAYLGGMDPLLESPRKLTPRRAVPLGSVGIAGMQTGIYPLQTPGGWQVIGRTPLTMFNAHRLHPALLKAGDEVFFNPVTEAEFHYIANNHAHQDS